MIISKTPVRISFFGGGTDYREFFEFNGGAILGTTIDKYTFISVNQFEPFFDYNFRVSYSKLELAKTIDEIVHPSVRETMKFKKISDNIDIHIFAELPARTGLGSSSSFTVGLLNALYALEGLRVSKQKLAEEAIYIEQSMIGERVGCQDQFHAAFGGLNIIEFKKNSITVEPVIISNAKLDLLQDSLMVFYTRLTRYANEVLEEQIEKTKTHVNDVYLERMRRMVYQAQEIISDAPEEEFIELFGKLLHESWELKKRLSSQIADDFINSAYKKALEAGAYGGKLGGAGGGGFLMLVVDKDKQPAVKEALKELIEVKFRFENEGSKIIYMKQ